VNVFLSFPQVVVGIPTQYFHLHCLKHVRTHAHTHIYKQDNVGSTNSNFVNQDQWGTLCTVSSLK